MKIAASIGQALDGKPFAHFEWRALVIHADELVSHEAAIRVDGREVIGCPGYNAATKAQVASTAARRPATRNSSG